MSQVILDKMLLKSLIKNLNNIVLFRITEQLLQLDCGGCDTHKF